MAQIARTVARALGLNADLAESLALSHDLGHTPFGHLGEEVLDPLVAHAGGFEHNRQTLRIVEVLEKRYPEFPGLNLSWEVREGIAKHSGPPDPERAPEFAEYEPSIPPPLEAQIIDVVDEIAYNHHDVDDGLESGLLSLEELAEAVELFGGPFRRAQREHPTAGPRMWVKIALRGTIDVLVTDLVETTRSTIQTRGIASVDDVRSRPEWLAGLSRPVGGYARDLKRYLTGALYHHPRIQQVKETFAQVLRDLFEVYASGSAALPERFASRAHEEGLERSVVDYIAGMTDRFALLEHKRLAGGPGPDLAPAATR